MRYPAATCTNCWFTTSCAGLRFMIACQWVKFASIAWSGDGFFYTRYPQPGTVPPEREQYFCQVWFHRVGGPQYSPYHNLADGIAYPPALIMTADTDDRVAPGMAKKFAARLQDASGERGGPILLRVEGRAGHGAGKPIAKQVDEQADVYAFLFTYLTRRSASEQTRPGP